MPYMLLNLTEYKRNYLVNFPTIINNLSNLHLFEFTSKAMYWCLIKMFNKLSYIIL